MNLACKGLALEVAGRTLCTGLTFTVQPGEVWGVLGPNGSGKTTLLNTLAGLSTLTQGDVTMDTQPLTQMNAVARARAVGILPQHEEAEYWGTALEYVSLGCFPNGSARRGWMGRQHGDEIIAERALQQAGMADFAARHFATLSGGERQRVRIAQLLAQAPRCLLLDEPLQHLDLRYQIQMLNMLATLARGDEHSAARSVILVLHDVLWPVRFCTHALLLDGAGGARAGAASDMLTQKNLESLFGCALQPAGDKPQAGFVPAL